MRGEKWKKKYVRTVGAYTCALLLLALSREDNKTDICPVCGTIEALDAWPFISEEGRRQVIEVTEKAEIENGRVKPLCKKDTDSRNKQ